MCPRDQTATSSITCGDERVKDTLGIFLWGLTTVTLMKPTTETNMASGTTSLPGSGLTTNKRYEALVH